MDNFNDGHLRKTTFDHHRYGVPRNNKYIDYSRRETRPESLHLNRFDKEHFHISQSTLCVPQNFKNSSFSAPYHHKSSSRTSVKRFSQPLMDEGVTNLPYYIVPVLYVPHKPLYEAKQAIEPNIYKAYHCKSKNQLSKTYRCNPELSASKSILNIYSKKNKKGYEYPCIPKTKKYSFDSYDEYFRRCIEEKKSSSDISFYTDKSYCHLTPKRSSRFVDDFVPASEKRKSISKNFPELFGMDESKTADFPFRPRVGEDIPTWDSPRTTNALIETDMMDKSCISAQTSFEKLKRRFDIGKVENQGTQTDIMDIKKNVLVVPKETVKERITPEGKPKNVYDGETLNQRFSDRHSDKTIRKPFGFNRSNSKFTVSRSTKSASYNPSRNSSRRSMDSGNPSVV